MPIKTYHTLLPKVSFYTSKLPHWLVRCIPYTSLVLTLTNLVSIMDIDKLTKQIDKIKFRTYYCLFLNLWLAKKSKTIHKKHLV